MPLDLLDKTQNTLLDIKTYPEFKKALRESHCDLCPLVSSRHHIVVDRGNPDTQVLMIGEAPGEGEDLQGKAFVGRSGQLLDAMMRDVGFDTNRESLIINVVKCRPPGNRQPKQDEVDACRAYLRKQIQLVNPRIILLLGATALRHIIPGKKVFSMGREAGKFFTHPEFPGVQFMVLFHPAYILRDPRKKPLMMEHLKHFKNHQPINREE